MIQFKNDMTLDDIERELSKGIQMDGQDYIVKDLYKNYDLFPFFIDEEGLIYQSSDTIINFQDLIDFYNLIEGSRS